MREVLSFGGEIVWHPTTEDTARSHLKQYMDQHHIKSFETLIERSTVDVAGFTDAVLRYLDIQFQNPCRDDFTILIVAGQRMPESITAQNICDQSAPVTLANSFSCTSA